MRLFQRLVFWFQSSINSPKLRDFWWNSWVYKVDKVAEDLLLVNFTNFVWLKPYSTKSCKKLLKYFFWLILQVNLSCFGVKVFNFKRLKISKTHRVKSVGIRRFSGTFFPNGSWWFFCIHMRNHHFLNNKCSRWIGLLSFATTWLLYRTIFSNINEANRKTSL